MLSDIPMMSIRDFYKTSHYRFGGAPKSLYFHDSARSARFTIVYYSRILTNELLLNNDTL